MKANNKDTEARVAALGLLRDGLVSPSEAARLAGVSRQLINHWINAAGFDPHHIREGRLVKEWRKRMAKKR